MSAWIDVPAGSAVKTVEVGGARIAVLEAADLDAELDRAVSAGRPAPYGRVLWPSAPAVAARLLEVDVRGVRVLELGAGCGLVSLACAQRGAHVIATDVDERALSDLAAAARMQGLALDVSRFDVVGEDPLPAADVVVVADLLYEEHLARAVARRVIEARARGSRCFVGDPGRVSRAVFIERLAAGGVEARFEIASGAGATDGTLVAVAVL